MNSRYLTSIQRWPHFLIGIFIFLLLGCLEDKVQTSSLSTQASWFEGVQKAKNLGGYPASVKVSWNFASKPVTSYRIYTLEYDPATKNNVWTQIDEVSSDVNSYIQSDLVAGQIYSYMVRAVDSSDVEESNNKQVSTVAFDGIGSVRTTGSSTAVVSLNTATGSFDEVRVYAQPDYAGSSKVLVGSARGTVDQIPVSGLHSGVRYRFSVSAYMNYLNSEDGNEVFLTAQTPSESFGSGLATDNNFSYRGFLNVQAFGLSPNSPVAPTGRMARLTWLAFAGASSETKYRVVRATTSNTIDMNTTFVCTPTTFTSCIVTCNPSGGGPQTCEDSQVGVPPLHYYYAVSLLKTDPLTLEQWVENMPVTNASDFYTKVSIPSDNMVLVQRDAANYEMCQKMGQVSNPRRNQRCVYTGIAATPYNTGPGKPARSFDSGFYDFGYNLFVDRYRTACNWTRNSTSCGPDGCIGYTTGAPSSALGNTGDVYFAIDTTYWRPNCYYKKATGWVSLDTLTDPTEIQASVTVDPGPSGNRHRPVISNLGGIGSFRMCTGQSTSYGNKRLLRRREHVHAAAFPTLPGEPNAITDVVEEQRIRFGYYNSTALAGGQLPGYRYCSSTSQSSMLTMPTTLSELINGANTRSQIRPTGYTGGYGYLLALIPAYFIGTEATSRCLSRWGTQDAVNPATYENSSGRTIMSDSFIRTSDAVTFPAVFAPVASNYDSGVVYDWNGFVFDGVIGPALGTTNGTWENRLNTNTIATYPRFVLPLGMPMAINNSTYRSSSELIYNGTLGSNAFNGDSNVRISHSYGSGQTSFVMSEGDFHRFSYNLVVDANGQASMHTWCALEAE